MTLLLTGFEPFGGRDNNLSWDVVSAIDGGAFSVGVGKALLPVSFRGARSRIQMLLTQYEPDVLLMTGFSSKRSEINIERVAVNIMDAAGSDNDGFSPSELPVTHGGVAAYFSTLPVTGIVAALVREGVDAAVSNSAGTFVCNSTYYSALEYVAGKGMRTKIGFVHFPDITTEGGIFALKKIIETLVNDKD